jgi:transcriptional regulator with XRE-family HTH domain
VRPLSVPEYVGRNRVIGIARLPDRCQSPVSEERKRRRVSSRMRARRAQLRYDFGKQYSARACAERAGIRESTWWSYERGISMPPAETAVAIAHVLGVTVEELEFRRVDAQA